MLPTWLLVGLPFGCYQEMNQYHSQVYGRTHLNRHNTNAMVATVVKYKYKSPSEPLFINT